MKLEPFDRETDALPMKVGKLEEAVRREWIEKLAALLARRDELQATIDEAMKATNSVWNTVSARAHDTWDELEKAAIKARTEL